MRTCYIAVGNRWIPREEYHEPERSGPMIMPDIKPYKSMIDGREITSRSRHREHLREHGCVEVGNDSSLTRPPRPIESPPGLKEVVIEAVNQHQSKRRL